ncbi:MAG TPA: hypothetical protein VG722_12025 [Tepidisphaeraceae bacterium]|nr:hypothetical protein [Tepidisphaeraceae bacterium]
MRPGTVILLLCIAAPLMAATESARQSQVAAASANAIDAIQKDIESQTLTPTLTVGGFLGQTHRESALRQLLAKLAPVGGARWLDSETCQVRLQIDGARVADLLISIAKANPKNTPIDAQSLQPMLRSLRQRSFEATSTSMAASSINTLAPSGGAPAWRDVSSDRRRQALVQARRNAIDHVIETLSPIELNDGSTIGQQMSSNPTLRKRLLTYLQTAPITRVDFEDNLQVRVRLRPSWEELAQTIYSARSGKSSGELNVEDFANIQHLRERISQRLHETTGTATAIQSGSLPEPAVVIPQQPPSWTDDQIETIGHGFVVGSQLKSSRAAEHDAKLKLRSRLEALHLNDAQSVLDAARRDPRVSDAINEVLEQARPYKSNYNADGSVTIYEILDLRDFWQAISQAQ